MLATPRLLLITLLITTSCAAYDKANVRKILPISAHAAQTYIIRCYPNDKWNLQVTYSPSSGEYRGEYEYFFRICGKRIPSGGKCWAKPLSHKNAKHLWLVCARDFDEQSGIHLEFGLPT